MCEQDSRRADDQADEPTPSTEVAPHQDERTVPDRGWSPFFTTVFSDEKMFRRFMLTLGVLLAFLLAAGWIWGAGAAGLTALAAGVLRAITKRISG